MRKSIWLFMGIFLIASASFLAGVGLQKKHTFLFIKRLLQGYPVYSPPPSKTILDWAYQKTIDLEPKFPLSRFPFLTIDQTRSSYIDQLTQLLGLSQFPGEFNSKTKILERVELKKVYREKIAIETEPGLWVPFYFFIPKEGPAKHPVIFVLHGHGGGKIETAGIVSSYQKSNALKLAQKFPKSE